MFKHVPIAARHLVLEAARDIRQGAKTRTQMGMAVGDNAYADVIHDEAQRLSHDLKDECRLTVPASTLRVYLWRAAWVGAMYA